LYKPSDQYNFHLIMTSLSNPRTSLSAASSNAIIVFSGAIYNTKNNSHNKQCYDADTLSEIVLIIKIKSKIMTLYIIYAVK